MGGKARYLVEGVFNMMCLQNLQKSDVAETCYPNTRRPDCHGRKVRQSGLSRSATFVEVSDFERVMLKSAVILCHFGRVPEPDESIGQEREERKGRRDQVVFVQARRSVSSSLSFSRAARGAAYATC